eukprot:573529-Hanusia_phi.AAC.1
MGAGARPGRRPAGRPVLLSCRDPARCPAGAWRYGCESPGPVTGLTQRFRRPARNSESLRRGGPGGV